MSECFAPLSAYVRRVQEVQEELEQREGVPIQRIIVSSSTYLAWLFDGLD